jgi:hypothetical protein
MINTYPIDLVDTKGIFDLELNIKFHLIFYVAKNIPPSYPTFNLMPRQLLKSHQLFN